MRTAVRTLVTLCVVALAVFAGYQLWQYYMLTPWTRDARVRADVVVKALAESVGGRGGGKPQLAQAGFPDATAIPGLLARAVDVVTAQVG